METFTTARPLVEHPDFTVQKELALSSLDIHSLDEPVRDVVTALNDMSFCFTIQSCFGHFVFKNKEPTNLEPLPPTEIEGAIEYRIAYVALCVQKCEPAARFLDELSRIQQIDPKYIQYGSADWFWDRHVNSYVIQVESERDMDKDTARINYQEARYIEELKRDVIVRIHALAKSCLGLM
ncbi:MAG: hypothetical protein JXM79_00770 [Sedimentisphaerales bacterium]|nr:hypothetical protein [Sedimentisphaerales bacterium]